MARKVNQAKTAMQAKMTMSAMKSLHSMKAMKVMQAMKAMKAKQAMKAMKVMKNVMKPKQAMKAMKAKTIAQTFTKTKNWRTSYDGPFRRWTLTNLTQADGWVTEVWNGSLFDVLADPAMKAKPDAKPSKDKKAINAMKAKM
jgi:hypothetical protein